MAAKPGVPQDFPFQVVMKAFKAPLLEENKPASPTLIQLEDVVQATEVTQNKEAAHSVRNEICFFFKKGLPLGLASVLEWGIPAM